MSNNSKFAECIERKNMKNRSTLIPGALLVLGLSTPAMANEAAKEVASSKTEMPMMSADQRQKMANAHQQMADCLKSDKSMSECHEQMRSACSEASDKGACMGMGMMGGRHPGPNKGKSTKEVEDKE